MGGHSKKHGKGGGGGGGGGRNNSRKDPFDRKKLKKDLGVPNLKEVANKIKETAQKKSRSIMSIGHLHETSSQSTVFNPNLRVESAKGAPSDFLARRILQSVSKQNPFSTPHEENIPGIDPEQEAANRKREMAALALRAAEKNTDYFSPMQLSANENGSYNSYHAMDEEFGTRATAEKSLRRFFKEFQHVVENCDVLLQVLDARDPIGCRLTRLEQSIRSQYDERKKRIVIVLNKVDMIPSKEIVDAWIHYFEQHEQITCIPFAATSKGADGDYYISNMFRVLRSLARNEETRERKAILVGVIGYPNVGKSSIINALKRKNVVGVGNTPGFTTGNTEIGLRSDIRVMDCPGVVLPGEDDGDVVLRNAIKVSDLADPLLPVQRLLQRCTNIKVTYRHSDNNINHSNASDGHGDSSYSSPYVPHPLSVFYGIGSFDPDDVTEFIRLVGIRRGCLSRGGIIDEERTARMILQDWNDGRIAYYTLPPQEEDFGALNSPEGNNPILDRGFNDNAHQTENGPVLVTQFSRGITFDGLPTFHIWMNSS